MTPLAHHCARIVLDTRNYPADSRKVLRDILFDTHFFECTALRDLVEWLADTLGCEKVSITDLAKYLFVPAEKTWVEFLAGPSHPGPFKRLGYLCTQDDEYLYVIRLSSRTDGCLSEPCYLGRLHRSSGHIFLPTALPQKYHDRASIEIMLAAVYLILINQPRIVERRQQKPHRGLQRDLLKSPIWGKYPLRAWTDLKLRVTPPPAYDRTIREQRLSGRKCLHFCRAHLRRWKGELIFVIWHWRGDASLGLKRTRYILT